MSLVAGDVGKDKAGTRVAPVGLGRKSQLRGTAVSLPKADLLPVSHLGQPAPVGNCRNHDDVPHYTLNVFAYPLL